MNLEWPNPRFATCIGVLAGTIATAGFTPLVEATSSSSNENATPRVIAVNANAYGNTYGEWGARWTQWFFSIPADKNPYNDTTGANCAEGQSGPVWFLAGGPGDVPPTRICTVPAGKAIFFPIANGMFGAGVFDCEPTVPGVPCNIATLRSADAAAMDSVTLNVEIDGKALSNLNAQRVTTPVVTMTVPENSVFGADSGTYTPNVVDGYWLMLAPLRAGGHNIHLKAQWTAGAFAGSITEATYHLTVSP